MSNNNSNKDFEDPMTERQQEEDETIDYFFHLVQDRLENSPTLEEHLLYGRDGRGGNDNNDRNDDDYRAEEELLMKVNQSGLFEGAVAGVVTFLSLVAGPPLVRRYLMSSSSRRHYYKLDVPPSSQQQRGSSNNIGKYVLMTGRLGIQVATSLVVAAYTSSYYTDESYMLEELARTPLLEGRSVIADEFCHVLSREYHRTHSREYWNNVQSPYLRQLGTFVKNCQRRQSYYDNEILPKRLERLEQEPPAAGGGGLSLDLDGSRNSSTAATSSSIRSFPSNIRIPPPGVPPNYPIDNKYLLYDNENDETNDDDDHGTTTGNGLVMDDDANWVEAFVTGNEERDERR